MSVTQAPFGMIFFVIRNSNVTALFPLRLPNFLNSLTLPEVHVHVSKQIHIMFIINKPLNRSCFICFSELKVLRKNPTNCKSEGGLIVTKRKELTELQH